MFTWNIFKKRLSRSIFRWQRLNLYLIRHIKALFHIYISVFQKRYTVSFKQPPVHFLPAVHQLAFSVDDSVPGKLLRTFAHCVAYKPCRLRFSYCGGYRSVGSYFPLGISAHNRVIPFCENDFSCSISVTSMAWIYISVYNFQLN